MHTCTKVQVHTIITIEDKLVQWCREAATRISMRKKKISSSVAFRGITVFVPRLSHFVAEKKFYCLIHHTKSSGRKFFSRLSKSVAQKTFYMGSSCLFYWPWVWNPQKELISTVKHYYVSIIYRDLVTLCSLCCQPVLSVRLLHISIIIWSRFVQDLDLSGMFSLIEFDILQHDLYSLDHYGAQDGWG